jgi:hypothetical protein
MDDIVVRHFREPENTTDNVVRLFLEPENLPEHGLCVYFQHFTPAARVCRFFKKTAPEVGGTGGKTTHKSGIETSGLSRRDSASLAGGENHQITPQNANAPEGRGIAGRTIFQHPCRGFVPFTHEPAVITAGLSLDRVV